MSGLSGNIASLSQLSASLRNLPQVVAQKVASRSAPVLTALARATFNASENAYGTSWSPKADGTVATLRKSGALASKVQYVATGTKLRLALGTLYAKYQVGRRPITPRQGDKLPVEYSRALSQTAAQVCREELGQ